MLFDLPQKLRERLNVLDLNRLKAFSFVVQIDGDFIGQELVAGFTEVRRLGDSVMVREVAEGGNRGLHRFPGRVQHDGIEFVRGMSFSRALYNWYQAAVTWEPGQDDYRRSLSVYIISQVKIANGVVGDFEAWKLDLYDAWPSEWRGPALNANRDELAFESVVLQHAGLTEGRGIFSGAAGEILSSLVG